MLAPAGRRADARRNEARILEGAARVLAAAPSAGMGELAEGAGVGRATLYRHFPTRAALLQALHARVIDDLEAGIDAAGLDDGPAPEALARLVEACLAVGDRYRFLSGVEREAAADIDGRIAALGARTEALVARGQAAGELSAALSPAFVSAALGALLMGALEEVAAGRLPAADAPALVVAFALDGLRP